MWLLAHPCRRAGDTLFWSLDTHAKNGWRICLVGICGRSHAQLFLPFRILSRLLAFAERNCSLARCSSIWSTDAGIHRCIAVLLKFKQLSSNELNLCVRGTASLAVAGKYLPFSEAVLHFIKKQRMDLFHERIFY